MRMVCAMSLSSLLTLACGNPFTGGYACTADVRPAIEVEIRDAQTNTPLAREAVGVVRDGSFADSLRPARFLNSDPASMVSRQAAGERPGTYTVEIQRAGYQTWTVRNVPVLRGNCHVQTRTLRADLVPVAP